MLCKSPLASLLCLLGPVSCSSWLSYSIRLDSRIQHYSYSTRLVSRRQNYLVDWKNDSRSSEHNAATDDWAGCGRHPFGVSSISASPSDSVSPCLLLTAVQNALIKYIDVADWTAFTSTNQQWRSHKPWSVYTFLAVIVVAMYKCLIRPQLQLYTRSGQQQAIASTSRSRSDRNQI